MTETAALTWDDVLKREDLIDGDIEWYEDGPTFRGPLIAIQKKGDKIEFTSSWFAKQVGDEWENAPEAKTVTAVDETCKPRDNGNGEIRVNLFFHIGCAMAVTLFPKGGSKLDSLKVKGLATGLQH